MGRYVGTIFQWFFISIELSWELLLVFYGTTFVAELGWRLIRREGFGQFGVSAILVNPHFDWVRDIITTHHVTLIDERFAATGAPPLTTHMVRGCPGWGTGSRSNVVDRCRIVKQELIQNHSWRPELWHGVTEIQFLYVFFSFKFFYKNAGKESRKCSCL